VNSHGGQQNTMTDEVVVLESGRTEKTAALGTAADDPGDKDLAKRASVSSRPVRTADRQDRAGREGLSTRSGYVDIHAPNLSRSSRAL